MSYSYYQLHASCLNNHVPAPFYTSFIQNGLISASYFTALAPKSLTEPFNSTSSYCFIISDDVVEMADHNNEYGFGDSEEEKWEGGRVTDFNPEYE